MDGCECSLEIIIAPLKERISEATVFGSKHTIAEKIAQIIGNKAKRRISKQVFQESKARQNFQKTNISYLLIRTRFGVLCFLETPVLRFALFPYKN